MNVAVEIPPGGGLSLSRSPIEVIHNELYLFGKRIMDIVAEHGFDKKGNAVPLKIYYTPATSQNVMKAQTFFSEAIEKSLYQGNYIYSYPTKPNHYIPIAKEIFSGENVHMESSSAFDIDLAEHLEEIGVISKDTFVIHNGIKTPEYLEGIQRLYEKGFTQSICVLDDIGELKELEDHISGPYKIGIRMSTREKGTLTQNSRLGIPEEHILPFIQEKIQHHPHFSLTMLHFFMNKGIKDTQEYYDALRQKVELFCEAKKLCPSLTQLNIGGGMPVSYEKAVEIDYQKIIGTIVATIKEVCDKNGTPHPDIISEFGTYTVAESGYNIYPLIRQKDIGNGEKTSTIDSSIANDTPDVLLLGQKFPVYPINRLDAPTEEVFIDGLTCDTADIYPEKVELPIFKDGELQWILVGKTGAYNDNISGGNGENGQLSHCMLQSPKTIFYGHDWEILKVFGNDHDADKKIKLRLLGAQI